MIDTVMALWNRGQRKKGVKVFFTFFLICISISLLLVIVGDQVHSKEQYLRSITAATNVVKTVQANTGGPTPTSVPPTVTAADTPIATSTVQHCTNTPTGTANKAYSALPSVVAQQSGHPDMPTLAATHPQSRSTPTRPTIKPTPKPSPAPTVLPIPTVPLAALTTPTPRVTPTTSPAATPDPMPSPAQTPLPIPTITPISTATAVSTVSVTPTTPTVTSTSSGFPNMQRDGGGPIVTRTPGGQPIGGGVASNCTSNSVSAVWDVDIMATLAHNAWFIGGGTLLGTLLFYGAVLVVRRRRNPYSRG